MIAHRLKTVQRADDILILEDGRVVEYGPRLALASDPGSRFSHLLQTGSGGGAGMSETSAVPTKDTLSTLAFNARRDRATSCRSSCVHSFFTLAGVWPAGGARVDRQGGLRYD